MKLTANPNPYATLTRRDVHAFQEWGGGFLPGHLGIELLVVSPERVLCVVELRNEIMAPHGYLHGGTPVAIADTLCGYGCIVNLPEGATGFTTIELKANFLGTTRSGSISCEAFPVHLGRTTQVWDAKVYDVASGRVIATFRCTQMVLWPAQSMKSQVSAAAE